MLILYASNWCFFFSKKKKVKILFSFPPIEWLMINRFFIRWRAKCKGLVIIGKNMFGSWAFWTVKYYSINYEKKFNEKKTMWKILNYGKTGRFSNFANFFFQTLF